MKVPASFAGFRRHVARVLRKADFKDQAKIVSNTDYEGPRVQAVWDACEDWLIIRSELIREGEDRMVQSEWEEFGVNYCLYDACINMTNCNGEGTKRIKQVLKELYDVDSR